MKITPIHQDPIKVKIQLEHTDVFRIVLVPKHINMLQFHIVCQVAMGWMMYHLFSFTDKKGNNAAIIAGLPEEEDFNFFSGPKEVKADSVKLTDFQKITDEKPFWYWYDFGDDWWHKISFQKPTKKDLELYKGDPICVKGEKACPPEDIGGVGGYSHFLYVMTEDIQPDKADLMEIFGFEEGEDFDPNYFDIEITNKELEEVSQSEEWNKTADDFLG